MTNEQLREAMQAFLDMNKAALTMQRMMRELGWSEFDASSEIENASDFDRLMWEFLDASAYPGCEIMTCANIAEAIKTELRDREIINPTE